ncbi:MAG: DNA primase [Desulfuromonas sp.]|mgnify:CR=1 FL=1|nr:MAG: DNA primase [Desulfuromonas sp.]
MTGQIADDKIHEVRERTDIVALVSSYVTLKRSGANHSGLCPFHSEKSPSFSVNAARQFFHCFGCGVGGDAFSFLMKMEGLAFPDAVRRLAERCGVELLERSLSPAEEQRIKTKERLLRVNEVAAAYFHRLLMDEPAGEPGRHYLKRRGYGRNSATEYQLGFAPDGWDKLTGFLRDEGVQPEDARALGLIRPGKDGRSDYDLFRRRLIFPVFDLAGRVVAFGGRILGDDKPKYINSPESPVYHKGKVLFGLYQARQAMRRSGEAVLVEGYFDQLSLERAGVGNAVATCGTALTAEHARLLKRYAQRVLLLFDQDAAGRKATFRAMETLQAEGLPAVVVDLPAGDDPDSFLGREGVDAFRQRMAQARPALELFMDESLASADNSIEARVRAAEDVLRTLAALSSELEQDLYVKQLAEKTGIALDLLQQKLQNARDAEKIAAPPVEPPRQMAVAPEPYDYPLPEEPYERFVEPEPEAEPQMVWGRTEKTLLGLILLVPDARRQVAEQGVELFFVRPAARTLVEQILQRLDGVSTGEEAFHLKSLDNVYQPLLSELLQIDTDAFAETYEKQLQDCRRAVEREQLRQRLAELPSLIAAASGDRQIELMQEFTHKKKQLN